MLPNNSILLFDGASGIYIPQRFAEEIDLSKLGGVSQSDLDILRQGPDHSEYWDAWADTLDNAVLTDSNGQRFYLWQDGDVWAIPKGEEVEE